MLGTVVHTYKEIQTLLTDNLSSYVVFSLTEIKYMFGNHQSYWNVNADIALSL